MGAKVREAGKPAACRRASLPLLHLPYHLQLLGEGLPFKQSST
jgi:hypothetical protein